MNLCKLGLIIAVATFWPLSLWADISFVTVENHTDQHIKVAIPGASPIRLAPGAEPTLVNIETSLPNGVDAKAWWISNPRQLCVIFVRYEGRIVVAGDKNIRCLGH